MQGGADQLGRFRNVLGLEAETETAERELRMAKQAKQDAKNDLEYARKS